MPQRFGEIVTGEVELGPIGAALTFAHAADQRGGNRDRLPHRPSRMRFLPDATNTAQYLVPPDGWRPHYGGLSFVVRLPSGESGRIFAIILDPDIARRVWGYMCDPTRKWGSVILQNVNGKWYAIMRFRRKGGRRRGPNQRKGKESHIYNVPAR